MKGMISMNFQLWVCLALCLSNSFERGDCKKMNDTFIISDDFLLTVSNFSIGSTVMPPGCTCMKNNVLLKECDAFECPCLCDMNAGFCDFNCCCDKECTDDEIIRFDTCTESGSVNGVQKLCYETRSGLNEINPVYPTKKSNSPKGKLHGLLCVEYDNSAVKGEYFDHIEQPSTLGSISDQLKVIKPKKFSDEEVSLKRQSFSEYFLLGDTIPAFMEKIVSNRQQFIDAFGRKMVIPTAGDGGICHDMNPVRFGENTKSSCVRLIRDVEKECENQLSIDRFISNIYIGRNQNIESPQKIGEYKNQKILKVVLSKIVQEKMEKKIVADISTKISQWNTTTNVCQQALRGLSYQILYDINGTISQVLVVATATEISHEKSYIEQEFTITFEPVDMLHIDHGSSTNNLIPRTKSGNPGYRLGNPTLAAKKNIDDNSTLSLHAFVNGFSIMNTGFGGQCETVNPFATVVGFGMDYRVSCNIEMSVDELEKMCSSLSHPYLLEKSVGKEKIFLPRWLESITDFVGIFGNADPLDKSQWLPIHSPFDEPLASLKNRIWLPSENKCEGIITQLEYDLLWTYVGNKERPQAKIIGAKKRFNDDNTLEHLMGDLSQKYEFVTTVTWTYVHPEGSIVKLSTPSLLFSMPHDVFYPFFMDQSSSFAINPGTMMTIYLFKLMVLLVV